MKAILGRVSLPGGIGYAHTKLWEGSAEEEAYANGASLSDIAKSWITGTPVTTRSSTIVTTTTVSSDIVVGSQNSFTITTGDTIVSDSIVGSTETITASNLEVGGQTISNYQRVIETDSFGHTDTYTIINGQKVDWSDTSQSPSSLVDLASRADNEVAELLKQGHGSYTSGMEAGADAMEATSQAYPSNLPGAEEFKAEMKQGADAMRNSADADASSASMGIQIDKTTLDHISGWVSDVFGPQSALGHAAHEAGGFADQMFAGLGHAVDGALHSSTIIKFAIAGATIGPMMWTCEKTNAEFEKARKDLPTPEEAMEKARSILARGIKAGPPSPT